MIGHLFETLGKPLVLSYSYLIKADIRDTSGWKLSNKGKAFSLL